MVMFASKSIVAYFDSHVVHLICFYFAFAIGLAIVPLCHGTGAPSTKKFQKLLTLNITLTPTLNRTLTLIISENNTISKRHTELTISYNIKITFTTCLLYTSPSPRD